MGKAAEPVSVGTVTTRADRRAWVELPYRLHAGASHWVPPLRHTERRRWSPRHNPTLVGRSVARFLARRAGRVVGRIAAIVDPAFQRWSRDTGFFGFFEAVDDEAVADALFGAAEAALIREGMRKSLGPVNLSTHDETGFLVDGFDRPNTILEPYNPPSYPRLAELRGYRAVRDYHAYHWRPDREPSRAVLRLLDRLERHGAARGIAVRSVTDDRWDDEVRLLYGLYNRCFTDLWGFVPITYDDFTARARAFRPFYRPETILVASVEREPVGFAIALPDANRAIAPVRGRLLPFGWLRVARAIPRITATRFILMGVLPEHRGKGVAPLLAGAMHRAGQRLGVTEGELSLVQGANDPMRHVIEAFSAERIKTFRLYARPLE